MSEGLVIVSLLTVIYIHYFLNSFPYIHIYLHSCPPPFNKGGGVAGGGGVGVRTFQKLSHLQGTKYFARRITLTMGGGGVGGRGGRELM